MRDDLKCPKCDSSQTRYRVRTQDHICYVCGNVYKVEKTEEDSE